MPTTAMSVKVTEEQRERLAKIAKATKRTAHFHMREALDAYLNEKEWWLDFIREADEAMEDYKTTGLHLTQEDMDNWIKSGMGELPPWRT